jgi:hypothetical protein
MRRSKPRACCPIPIWLMPVMLRLTSCRQQEERRHAFRARSQELSVAGPFRRRLQRARLPPRLGAGGSDLPGRAPEQELESRLPSGANRVQSPLLDNRLSTLSPEDTVYPKRAATAHAPTTRGTRDAGGGSPARRAACLLKRVSTARRHRGNDFSGRPGFAFAALALYRPCQNASATRADGGGHEPHPAWGLVRWHAARTNAAIRIHQAHDSSRPSVRNSPAVSKAKQLHKCVAAVVYLYQGRSGSSPEIKLELAPNGTNGTRSRAAKLIEYALSTR